MKFWRHTNWPPACWRGLLQLRGPEGFVFRATEQVPGPLRGLYYRAGTCNAFANAASISQLHEWADLARDEYRSAQHFFLSVYSAPLCALCWLWVLKISPCERE